MSPFREYLDQRRAAGLYRERTVLLRAPGKRVQREGRLCLNLSSNNYLDLAGHPALRKAWSEALEKDGPTAGGSRLLGGGQPLHARLEQALGSFRPCGDALLFNSGYHANTGLLPALLAHLGTAFLDRFSHASLLWGAVASRKPFHRFRHNDVNHLEELLKRHQPPGGGLVATESLFSMDGDTAPLTDLAELQKRYGFWLLVDEAHSVGTWPDAHLRACGGVLERTLFMGTFGKALAGYGAYVAAAPEVVETLAQSAPSFLFSTALPPPVAAGNLAALALVESKEEAHRPRRLRQVAAKFRAALRAQGCQVPDGDGPIVPWVLGSPERALEASAHLFDHGIHAPAVRPPTVPEGGSRLRFSLHCALEDSDVEEVAEACGSALRSLGSDLPA